MKIRASVRKICTKCRLIRGVGELESFVPIRSINKDRGNLSKKKLFFFFLISNKVKKVPTEMSKLQIKKMKVKDMF